jgi:AcrR family transcriptional regulator
MADEQGRADAGRRSPRERILEAMLDLSVSEGYERISVAIVLERADATQADFDADFAGLEDCALQLVDSFLPAITEKIEVAYRAQEYWPDALRAASYVVADWIVSHPREVQFGAVEMLKVGELARVRRESVFMSFAYMINAGRECCEDPASAPELVGERAIGSLAEILTKELRHGMPDAHSFVPQLMYLAVLPYLGEEEARKELSIPPPGEAGAR